MYPTLPYPSCVYSDLYPVQSMGLFSGSNLLSYSVPSLRTVGPRSGFGTWWKRKRGEKARNSCKLEHAVRNNLLFFLIPERSGYVETL